MEQVPWTLHDECTKQVDAMLDQISEAFGHIGLPAAADKLKGLIDQRVDARVEQIPDGWIED